MARPSPFAIHLTEQERAGLEVRFTEYRGATEPQAAPEGGLVARGIGAVVSWCRATAIANRLHGLSPSQRRYSAVLESGPVPTRKIDPVAWLPWTYACAGESAGVLAAAVATAAIRGFYSACVAR